MPGSLLVDSNGAATKSATVKGDVRHVKKKKPENRDVEKHRKVIIKQDKLVVDDQDEPSCDEEFSFSRAFHGVNDRRFSADDSIDFKPVFPVFNEKFIFPGDEGGDCTENMDADDRCPFPGTGSNAKKVFVKMPHINPSSLPATAGSGETEHKENDKKSSNLAGFSMIWKFKGLIHRKKSAAVTSAQENYLIRRAMAEERHKAYVAHRTMVSGGGGVHLNVVNGTASSRKVIPF